MPSNGRIRVDERAQSNHLTGERWVREGWLESGAYVQIFDPPEALDRLAAWGEAAPLHPGIYFLGGDGSRDLYCIEATGVRQPRIGVAITDFAARIPESSAP